jgi:hypothetical protein
MIGFGQDVYIPDANFKSCLVNNTAINTDGDSEIQVSEASAFTDTIYCNNLNISDLTGIEAFTALTYLNVNGNLLTSLDVSSNTALTYLNVNSNLLTSLDMSNNPALGYLSCEYNQLTSLDVSDNTALGVLYCRTNQLPSLDVSGATALITLNCQENQLTSLNVSSNTALTGLSCGFCQLTSLDVSNNPALTYLYCFYNQLECLNAKNGNNTTLYQLFAQGNPNLTCIEVDDVAFSGAQWTYDTWVSFSTDCNNACSACTPTSSTDSHTACESYTWLDGNTYTSSNNTATYTTSNAEGCDSTITLDLTINPLSTNSIIETACSFYIAPDDEVYTSTGNYTATIDNAAGCDSVITIYLTINPTPSGAVTQNGATLTATQTVAAYQWLDCDDESIIVGEINQSFTPTTTGNYAVIVTIGDCYKQSDCFLVNFTGIGELNNTPKQLIKIVDVLGRETPFKPNTPLLYIYNDGTVERKVIIEE